MHLESAALWMLVALLPDLNQHVIPACLLLMLCRRKLQKHPPGAFRWSSRLRFDALPLWTAPVICSLVVKTDSICRDSGLQPGQLWPLQWLFLSDCFRDVLAFVNWARYLGSVDLLPYDLVLLCLGVRHGSLQLDCLEMKCTGWQELTGAGLRTSCWGAVCRWRWCGRDGC